MTYFEKLKDPRWQKRRLELFEAANWTCKECGTKTETLHAHHGYYKRKTEPWNYPDDVMHVLCESCHTIAQGFMSAVHERVGRLPASEVGLLANLLSELSAVPDIRKKILTVFSDATSSANIMGFTIKEDEVGRGWLLHATLAAGTRDAFADGYDSGFAKGKSEVMETA